MGVPVPVPDSWQRQCTVLYLLYAECCTGRIGIAHDQQSIVHQ